MPVFALKMEFDDKGALVAVRRMRGVAEAAGDAQDAVRGMGAASSHAGKEISEAMKNAAKSILALVGAYKALDAAMNFVKRGVEFNASLESSKIGIASIITSMASLQDSQGRVLDGAEKYAAAQEVAAEMMKRIQVLGLETTATTQELVEGVQSVMGPALQAGLRLEKIPDFALNAAQAMQTMGIPLQQMRTELEALLTGNVNKAQDLLAPRLFGDVQGDLGAYIKQLRESGRLYDEIMKRLAAYKLAGQDVAQTLTGLMSNLNEALDVVSGQISKGLTQNLKNSVRSVRELLIATDQSGTGIGKDFEHIAAVLSTIETALGEGILNAVQTVTSWVKALNAEIGREGADAFVEKWADRLDDLIQVLEVAALGYTALKVTRAAYKSEMLQGIKADVTSGNVLTTLREKIISVDAALQKKIAADRHSAAASLEAAKADLTRLEREKALLLVQEKHADRLAARLVGTQNEERAEKLLAAARAKLVTVNEQLAASEARLASATLASTKATQGATRVQLAFSGLKTTLGGIVSFFGGPLGLAFTGASVAAAYLATKQTEAEEAALAHARALDLLEGASKGAGKAQNELSSELAETTKQKRISAVEEATEAYSKGIQDIQEKLSGFADTFSASFGTFDAIGDGIATALRASLEQVEQGTKSALDFRNEVAKALEELRTQGETGSKVYKLLTDIFNKAADDLVKYDKTLNRSKDALNGVAGAADNVASSLGGVAQSAKDAGEAIAIAFDSEKLKRFLDDVDFKIYANGLTDLQKAQAQALKGLGKTQEEIAKIFSGEIETPETNQILWRAAAGYASDQSVKQAEENVRKAEQARKKAESEAKATATAMKDLESQINRLIMPEEEYREWELVNHTLPELKQKLGETSPEIERFAAAQRKAWKDEDIKKAQEEQKKNAETINNFYREYAELSGDFTTSQKLQNQLIEEQVVLLKALSIPQHYIDDWKELQRLQMSREGWDGAIRGAKKFYVEATDAGKNFEDFMRSSLDGITGMWQLTEDGLVMDWRNTLLTMANDLSQILIRQFITGPLANGIAGLMGGGWSASSFSPITDVISAIPPLPKPFAKGGIVDSHMLSAYSGSVVSKPTFFDYRQPGISAFARGGVGLMGEAGPEAILPVEPLGGGRYGLRYSVDDIMGASPWRHVDESLQEATRESMRLLEESRRQAMEKIRSDATPQINIQVINETGTPATAQVRQSRSANGQTDIRVTLKKDIAGDVLAGGTISQAISARFGIQPYVRGR